VSSASSTSPSPRERVEVADHQPRCKLCKTAERSEIDGLLFLRSRGFVAPDGQKVNLQYVQRRASELGVPNVTKENVTTHWQKHCRVVELEQPDAPPPPPDADAEQKEAAYEEFSRLLDGDVDQVDLDGVLRAMFKVGAIEFVGRVKRGEAKISPELMIRISDAITKRRQNEAQGDLLRALAGGATLALQKAFGPEQPALPAADIVIPDPQEIEEAELVESG
jgi:hypothetical protein